MSSKEKFKFKKTHQVPYMYILHVQLTLLETFCLMNRAAVQISIKAPSTISPYSAAFVNLMGISS